jgi:DnaJ-class molecular chaperone
MSSRTHYVVLGVSPDEGTNGIRAAFRDLSRRYHPDHTGPGGASGFVEIADAFCVLGDERARRVYDAGLRREDDAPRSARAVASTVEAEPLIPDGTSLRRGSTQPARGNDALFARFARNFTGIGVPKAEHLEPLHVRVVVPPEEAARGTTLTLGLPVFERCTDCGGLGRTLLLGCATCAGEGVIELERPIRLEVPPFVTREVKVAVGLEALGIHNFFLIVHVAIDPLLA